MSEQNLTAIIITLCVLVLIAYIFELTSAKTRIPSVILLLLLGWLVRQATDYFGIPMPDLKPVLPVLGTVGLILIVLEGSLELEYERGKGKLIAKAFIVALLPMLSLALLLSLVLSQFSGAPFRFILINTIPFCVISSAIAIPSVRHLNSFQKEFVIYESSFSDIFGVLLFNFVALNHHYGVSSWMHFFEELLIIIAVSFISTVGLSYLMNKIRHHIKYIPIILLVILIYALSKVYHLPGLIFILFFGLFLGNLDEFSKFSWAKRFRIDHLNTEVQKFKELTIEGTFLVRVLFFILFGYLIETSELLNTSTIAWAAGIVAGIFLLRAMMLWISRLPVTPLLFIAPRGLITILLFLSIPEHQRMDLVNRSLVIQVVILAALVMMFGLMSRKRKEEN